MESIDYKAEPKAEIEKKMCRLRVLLVNVIYNDFRVSSVTSA